MKKFDDYLSIILRQEGGDKITKIKDDSGSTTKFGISLKFYKTIKPDATDKDIENLTYKDVVPLYKKYFWDACNLDEIKNELLKLHIFSHAVNRGIKPAVKLIQRIVGAEDDGKLGKTTAMMINSYRDQPELVNGYATARKVDYENVVANNPKLKKFLIGWYNRVDKTRF